MGNVMPFHDERSSVQAASEARVDRCTCNCTFSVHPCVTVLKLTGTRPSSAHVFLLSVVCCGLRFELRSVEVLEVCTSPCRRDQRSLTLQGALLCCGRNHVDKTRTSVTLRVI